MLNKEDMSLIALALGAAAALIGIIANRKVGRVAKAINRTVDDLSKKDLGIDIAEEFVEKAAKKQVERQIDRMLPGVKSDALKRAETAFKAAIDNEINSQYSDTKNAVKRALKDRIGHIDIDDIRREVIEDAKEEMNSRFKDDLAEAVDKYLSRIDDAGDVWKMFAKKLDEK